MTFGDLVGASLIIGVVYGVPSYLGALLVKRVILRD